MLNVTTLPAFNHWAALYLIVLLATCPLFPLIVASSMPSALRFRSTRGDSTEGPPRTPKSPRGFYTGEPVPFESSYNFTHKIKCAVLVVLLLLCTAATLLWFYPQLNLPGAFLIALLRSWAFLSPTAPQPKQFVPSFPVHNLAFQENYAFQDKGATGAHAWSSMFPPQDMRIAVNKPREFGLPHSSSAIDREGNKVPNVEVYDVSVVRQLGCLACTSVLLVWLD